MANKQMNGNKAAAANAKTSKSGTSGTRSTGKTKSGASNSNSGKSNQSIGASQTSNTLSQAQMTTDPDEIRQWVEERGGYPATVSGTGNQDGAGILRIDYPGYSGEGTLERISWEEFFDKFNDADLVFLYQEETKDGGPSRFSKLISRQEADAKSQS